MSRPHYDGPLWPGMILTAPDNEGVLGFRRDLLLAKHPNKPGIWIYEALPCRMRNRLGGGVGLIHSIPEENIRIVMRPEPEEDS